MLLVLLLSFLSFRAALGTAEADFQIFHAFMQNSNRRCFCLHFFSVGVSRESIRAFATSQANPEKQAHIGPGLEF
jgi:hypothetical protein